MKVVLLRLSIRSPGRRGDLQPVDHLNTTPANGLQQLPRQRIALHVVAAHLTLQLEREVQTYFDRIEALGGMLRAIERGWVQTEIQNAAYDYQRAVENGEQVVVGVNKFARDHEPGVPLQKIDPTLEQRQVERVQALRMKRDAAAWQSSISRVTQVAREGGNLMPSIVTAVESYATVGEIANAMRSVFGEYRERIVV